MKPFSTGPRPIQTMVTWAPCSNEPCTSFVPGMGNLAWGNGRISFVFAAWRSQMVRDRRFSLVRPRGLLYFAHWHLHHTLAPHWPNNHKPRPSSAGCGCAISTTASQIPKFCQQMRPITPPQSPHLLQNTAWAAFAAETKILRFFQIALGIRPLGFGLGEKRDTKTNLKQVGVFLKEWP